MKELLISLLLVAGVASGAEPFAFPLVGPLKIENATYFLDGDRTGGSVLVVLRDPKGNRGFVHYVTKDACEEHEGGLLTFRAEKNGKNVPFAHASEDEARLVSCLRAACVVSFGSADPAFLKAPGNWPGKKDGFSRMAMASLLRHFPTEAKQVGAESPATVPHLKSEGNKNTNPDSEAQPRKRVAGL